MTTTVLVLGGYGNFGTRICRALAGDPAIALLIGGRSEAKARALAQEVGAMPLAIGTKAPEFAAVPLAIDIEAPDLAARLRAAGVGIVIHTAGPFQGRDYAVARAAAAAGAHYIDLADGRRFVCDFGAALDADFRTVGRSAIAGASTVPALSSAVVDALTAGWRRLDAIDVCIGPAQTAPRGVATLEAVLGYCGAPVEVWRDGRWQIEHGWAEPTRVEFLRMKPRLGSLCDIPDLELFPARYAGVRDVAFRAALEVGLSQRGLAWLAAWRRRGWVRRPERFARLLNTTASWFDPFGSSLGGMVVRIRGEGADGRVAARAWHIAADDDHGPEIPCMAAILLARKLAQGQVLPVGAMPCMGLLELAEFTPEFARWGMVTDVVEEAA